MANGTPKELRNQILYSVFVRNYSQAGTFEALRTDLDRIKALGVDIIWLMPIHPIGKKARKGTVGSPYAICDYRKVDASYGTLEDLKRLVADIHARGMKCIIDVVYNHTSPDSSLANDHPEWFYHKPDGSFGNRVGDWTDIIDLDYSQPQLWDYQIETLKMWAQIVDGFRCDVAPLVPLAFWLRARQEVEKVRPGCIWLAESVEPEFILANRRQGIAALSDGELYQAFDICYDYDIFDIYRAYLAGGTTLREYADAVNRQEGMYPDNYVKLRCLENHDRPRAAQSIAGEEALYNWTAFVYFQKGLTMLYNGQESGSAHLPKLFEKDVISRKEDPKLAGLMRKMAAIKKDPVFTDSCYTLKVAAQDVLIATHEKQADKLVGIFSLRGYRGSVELDVPDGVYENLLGGTVRAENGHIVTDAKPIIIKM